VGIGFIIWLVSFIYYKCCKKPKEEEKRGTYAEKDIAIHPPPKPLVLVSYLTYFYAEEISYFGQQT
jgi:hypothetical protein